MNRYARQISLPQIGELGQKKLSGAHVLVVGCGALGSVISNNLARAGVGRLTLVDRDVVDITNLQRQILFTEADALEGAPKSEASARVLRRANSEIVINAHQIFITPANIGDYLEGVDVVADATDNMDTRFVINDACIAQRIPWVMGAVAGTGGMSMTIVSGKGPCLRCWLGEAPPKSEVPTAMTHGVINSITSVIGSIESAEVIKLIVDSDTINKKLIRFDVWNLRFTEFSVERNPSCLCSR